MRPEGHNYMGLCMHYISLIPLILASHIERVKFSTKLDFKAGVILREEMKKKIEDAS